MNSKSDIVALHALARMSKKSKDEFVYGTIVIMSNHISVIKEAIVNIEKLETFEKIALESKYSYAIIYALRKIENSIVVKKVLNKNDKKPEIQLEALKMIEDQLMLANFILNSENMALKEFALKKMSNGHRLAKVVCDSKDHKIQLGALEKIKDEKILGKIMEKFLNEGYILDEVKSKINVPRKFIHSAILEMTDKYELIDVILNDENLKHKKDVLAEIINRNELPLLISALKEKAFIDGTSLNSDLSYILKEAEDRLNDLVIME